MRVDYAGLRRDPRWPRAVAALGPVDPEALRDPRERLAFWINAYNLLAIDLVVRHPGIASLRDVGSFLWPVWRHDAGRAAGRMRSLGEIEHEILRPLGDPRIHAAIVCASVSCPPLRREPFAAGRLDAQLDEQMRLFLASPEKGLRLDPEAGTLALSAIFDWFEEDFAASGGVLAFVTRYAPEPARLWLVAHAGAVRLRSLPYDWRLNALEVGAAGPGPDAPAAATGEGGLR